MKSLDDFLPVYEFSERHSVAIAASASRIDDALRAVSLADIPVARGLWRLRRLGQQRGDATRPFVDEFPGLVLEDVPHEGIVLGLTGQFWLLRGGIRDPGRPRAADEFLAYHSAETCKAVIDLRVGPQSLSTETRVHVEDPRARRKFRRYWFVIRPFSGLIRILLLRTVRRRAEALT
jgi:hypothetical protein